MPPSLVQEDSSVKMQYRRLGKTGLKVSRICLGTMSYGTKGFAWTSTVLEKDEAIKLIGKAWNSGINFYDTAHFYSNGESERILGAAIKELGIPRDEIVIATKVSVPVEKKDEDRKVKGIKVNAGGLSRKILFESVNAALERLQTDYIDLYQISRWDKSTPIEETMKALHDLVQAGKIRYIGASTMWAWQFAKAQSVAALNGWTQFVSMQNLYNLAYREEEREMIPLCLDQGIGVIPWSPLAHGFLVIPETSEYKGLLDFNDEASKAIKAVVMKFAEEKKVSPAAIALAWLLHKDVVVAPIVGVSSEKHLEQALDALSVKLTEKEILELEQHYKPKKVMGFFDDRH